MLSTALLDKSHTVLASSPSFHTGKFRDVTVNDYHMT